MKDALIKYINDIDTTGVCVAFSGGVDSSLLLKIATLTDKKVIAVTFETFLHPTGDLQKAQAIAQEYNAEHFVIKINELDNPKVINNPVDRCYHCKHMLFEQMIDFAKTKGIDTVIDGTNYDDLHEYRPGLKALKELKVLSPLAELKMTKKQVRELAQHMNLEVASKPSAPCLATRLPYNTKITTQALIKIDAAELFIKELGFKNVRVRLYDNLARIEVDKKDFIAFIEHQDEITNKLKSLEFTYITLDLEGFRSGSMDINL